MAGSRTIKSLAFLVMAMTLGTFVLMLLEHQAEPLRPPVDYLAAITNSPDDLHAAIWQIQAGPQYAKWRYVMVHTAGSFDDPIVQGCHFVISPTDDGRSFRLTTTDRWQRQDDGRHINIVGQDYNRNSIGVCVVGNFASQPPAQQEFDLLVGLVRQLRKDCRIAADQVYVVPHHLSGRSDNFPAEHFQRLISGPTR